MKKARKAKDGKLTRFACGLLFFGLVAEACGGSTLRVKSEDAAQGAGGLMSGAGGAATGGTGGTSLSAVTIVLDASLVSKDDHWIPGDGRDVSTEAGVLECACGSDNTATCDEGDLDAYFAGLRGRTIGTQCILWQGNTFPDGGPANLEIWGSVVFDSDGRALDGSGLAEAGPPPAIPALADYRWPCFAGQMVSYVCLIGYE